MILSGFTELIAERMRAEHRVLAARWFERLLDLLPVDARHVFPTESLLDHIPALILEVAGYLREPDDQAIAANTTILEKARELGELRHGQRASLHQVLREYQVLNGVLVAFVVEEMERLQLTPLPVESVSLVSRLNQAVHLLSQSTVESFVTLYTRTIAEQNERLEQFTRMAAHEWRQPVGALLFGINLLTRSDLDAPQTERTLSAVERNVQHLIELTRKLEVLARVQDRTDGPIVQEVSAGTVAREAARQLREMAHARGVEVRIADDMPTLTVDVGRLELALLNLLSNAIKYSDAAKPERYVDVRGGADGAWCRLEIRDNGVGIPDEALPRVFQRFTRAHTERDDLLHVGGIGLGLSITEDCVRAMGGQIDVRSVEREGTAFVLTLPLTPAAG
jgi:signal transduction histidine kinase